MRSIGQADWDHRPLLVILAQQVGLVLGEPDGVIVFDPSAFTKKGDKSVGVARQWYGRLGKVENCQVGVYLGYVARMEPALVNFRLYLHEGWAKDRARQPGVPKTVELQTRQSWRWRCSPSAARACRMAGRGRRRDGSPGELPPGIAGPRRALPARRSPRIHWSATGTCPRGLRGAGSPSRTPFTRVDRSREALPEGAWAWIEVRDGEKGPLVVEAVKRWVRARSETGGEGPDETLFITRELQSDNTYKLNYYLLKPRPLAV